MVFAATPPYDGTLTRYYCVPGDLAHPIPDTMSLEEGALACILTLIPTLMANVLVSLE
jgi:D-xylulose reductase